MGHNFAILGPTENKTRVRLFFVLMQHIKFQAPSSSGSLVSKPAKDETDRRTDGPKPICPLNFFESGDIKTISKLTNSTYRTVGLPSTLLFYKPPILTVM